MPRFAAGMIGAALLVGCTGDAMTAETDGPPPAGAPASAASLVEQLRSSRGFMFARELTSMTLVARMPSADPPREATVELDLTTGAASVHVTAEGQIVLEAFDMGLGDIVIPADVLPPEGLTLTDLELHLRAPAAGLATWGAEGGTAEISVSLLFDWSVETSLGPAPLAEQQIDDLSLSVTVREDLGALALGVEAQAEGTLFNWSRFAEIGDLELGVLGLDQAVPDLQ